MQKRIDNPVSERVRARVVDLFSGAGDFSLAPKRQVPGLSLLLSLINPLQPPIAKTSVNRMTRFFIPMILPNLMQTG